MTNNTDLVAPGGVIHRWEFEDVLREAKRLRAELKQVKRYARYLANRMQDQALIINEKVNPVVAASMFDDLDDAASIAGIEPREWKELID